MPRQTKIQETSTRKKVDLILKNLGWIIDEEDRNCNVTTESPKTREQAKKLERKKADYFLYKSGTDRIIALIETKRPDESIKDALSQAIEYAEFLNVNIVFATDGTITQTYHLKGKSELRKDGEFIGELLSEKELIKFIDSPEIESPRAIQYTKQELIKIFQRANELLRKDGLREGIERFTEFSNLLFMRMISEIEDEREQEGLPRRLEKRYCWDSFKGKDGQEILDYINDTILPKLVNKYNGSGDVFQNELNIKNPDTIKEIVDKLSKLNLIDIESDVKGDAFEYFLKESVTVGNDLGEYFTPRHIVKLIVRLVDPKFGDKVYDPCCGTGGFLIEAYKHLWNKCNHTSENTQFLKEKTIYGREITGTAKIAKMNMILAGDGHTNIKQMDSLEFPVKSRFGVVLTNFPFSQKTDYGTLYGFNTSDANPIFIKHIIDSLEEGGRAGIITFQGLLYDQIETYKKIRQFLVENCYVEGIIKLHNYVFQPYTSVNTSIIILKKGKPAKNIWFFVVNEDGFEKTSSKKGRSPIEKNDLKMLEEVWAEKRNSEKSWAIDIQTIKSNSYILNAETYKPHKKSESKFQLDVLSKHVDIINEKGAKGKNRYVEIGDIELDSKNYFYKEKPSVESCKKAFLGNIIISTVRPTRGAISYIKEEEITVSSAFLVIKSNELVITNRFLYFLLAFNNKFYTYMGDKAQGSTYPTIKEKEILNFKIPLISKETQEQKLPIFENRLKIILDTSNSIKSLTDNLFDPFLFNGGYDKITIGDLIDNEQIQNGLYKEKSFYGSGIPIVRIDNFYNGKLIYNNLKKLNITDEEKKRYFLKKGDILLNRVNSDEFVGKCCIFNGENSTTVYESNIMRFRVKEDKILPEYLVFYLSSVGGKEQILSKIKRAVNQVSVNQEDIKSIEIPLPKLEKQSVIIDIINKNIKTAEFLKDIRNSNKNYLKEEIDSFYSNL